MIQFKDWLIGEHRIQRIYREDEYVMETLDGTIRDHKEPFETFVLPAKQELYCIGFTCDTDEIEDAEDITPDLVVDQAYPIVGWEGLKGLTIFNSKSRTHFSPVLPVTTLESFLDWFIHDPKTDHCWNWEGDYAHKDRAMNHLRLSVSNKARDRWVYDQEVLRKLKSV